MDLLKTLQKKITSYHVIAVLGIVVLAVAFCQYSQNKTLTLDGMSSDNSHEVKQKVESTNYVGANPVGENEVFSQISGITTTNQDITATGKSSHVTKPEDLLPTDQNSDWARLNPSSNGDLSQVNLLKAGYHNGVDTVGSSLRNANLQLRSEPPNPQTHVSPWMNTTITPDLERKPLDGC